MKPITKITFKLLMLMLIARGFNGQPALAQDGDKAFWRVDTRTPAHQLPEGVCADAVNCRFDDGKCSPRQGVSQQAWGRLNIIPSGTTWPAWSGHGDQMVTITGFVPGQKYLFIPGTYTTAPGDKYTDVLGITQDGVEIDVVTSKGGIFTATQNSYQLALLTPQTKTHTLAAGGENGNCSSMSSDMAMPNMLSECRVNRFF
jgi:hypothetical protein